MSKDKYFGLVLLTVSSRGSVIFPPKKRKIKTPAGITECQVGF
jgi:hypothetical protein